jgi:hypothetical protein
MLLPRLSEVSTEFDLSASDNLIIPASPILLPVLSENRQSYKRVTTEIE